MTLKECMLINNDCFKAHKPITVTGIVVHSTGANNKTLKRYVNPIKTQECYADVVSDIGINLYGNHWNRSAKEMGSSKCVHAFIGVNSKGEIETYQTLPFEVACWGVGSGKNGSYNYNPQARIQFEICEDGLADETYFNSAMKEAIEFCTYLCKTYNLSVSDICSHYEAYKAGYGSNHGDIDYWLKKFGKNMDWFRTEVDKLLSVKPKSYYTVSVGTYTVRKNADKIVEKLYKAGFKPKITEVKL